MPRRWVVLFVLIALLIAIPYSGWLKQSGAVAASVQQGSNPCPEGQYLDISEDVCRELMFPERGFKGFSVSADVYTTSCSEADIEDKLLQASRNGGGTVTIPACTVDIAGSLEIPSNVVLQGAGKGLTVLRATDSTDGHMIEIRHQENVILRDLTIDGQDQYVKALMIWYAGNVLVERIEARDTGRSGPTFRYSDRITLRYIESYGHGAYHGLSNKDCFRSSLSACQQEFDDNRQQASYPGVLWSQDYSVYSNRVWNNGTQGIDLHGILGEVAGNYSHDNPYGSKFPDAQDVWIHHNRIENSDNWGMYIYSTLDDIPSRQVKDVYVLFNVFEQNDPALLVRDEPTTVYAGNNSYGNNDGDIRVESASLYLCGSDLQTAGETGATVLAADSQTCDSLLTDPSPWASTPTPSPIPPTPGDEQTIETTARVMQSEHDIERLGAGETNGDIHIFSDNLDLGENSVLIVFTDVRVPTFSQIEDARVIFEASSKHEEPTQLTIQRSNDGTFTNLAGTLIDWAIDTPWEWGTRHETPNLAPLLQGAVNAPSWTAGQEITLVFQGSGKRAATSFDGDPSSAPQLVVRYADTGEPTPPPLATPTATPTPEIPPWITPEPDECIWFTFMGKSILMCGWDE